MPFELFHVTPNGAWKEPANDDADDVDEVDDTVVLALDGEEDDEPADDEDDAAAVTAGTAM